MTRHNKNKPLHKKLVHRTINAQYKSRRSLIVMLGIVFMVAIHMVFLGGYDALFNPPVPDVIKAEQGDSEKAAESDVLDVVLEQPGLESVQIVKPAHVREGYDFPLHAERHPYDPSAEDELRVKIPTFESSISKPKPVFQYALNNPSSKKVRIAIIIDDMGMNVQQSHAVINIQDAPLTLAFLPYAPHLDRLTKPAIATGHELMIHMPMEPMSSKVPLGPIAIKDGMGAQEISAMLDKAYASFDGFTGLNNHMGSRSTQNKAAMDIVMDSLDAHGLFYVDSKTISTSVAAKAAREQGVSYAERDVFLDHEETLSFARNALKKLESVALKNGHAIAIGHPKVHTVQALKEWIPTLEARGFEIVPVSALLLHPRKAGTLEASKIAAAPYRSKLPIVKEKGLVNMPSATSGDVSDVEPAAGDVEKHVATEDLLNAPIGLSQDFKVEVTGGLYSLSR